MMGSERKRRSACRRAAGVAVFVGMVGAAPTSLYGVAAEPAFAVAPPPILAGLAVAPAPGTVMPLDAALTDQDGRPVRLGEFFGAVPVVVVLGYYHCPMLCPIVFAGLAHALADAGNEQLATYPVRVLTISIDPHDRPEDGRRRRTEALTVLADTSVAVDWTFLVGAPETVTAIAQALGFRYRRDPASGEYAHPAALFVVAADGRLARVIAGVAPTGADLVDAFAAARRGEEASPGDDTNEGGVLAGLLQCFRYTPALRRHGGAVRTFFRIGGVLVLVAVAAIVVDRRTGHGRGRQ